jgi:hypothetical protein
MSACIKKGYLYDDEGGTEEMTYDQWADYHVQDSEAALSIAKSMLADEDGRSDNFDLMERVFEVYTIIDRAEFVRQANAYNDEDQAVTAANSLSREALVEAAREGQKLGTCDEED